MYSVFDYGRMAADTVRMDAYARAIERTVRPGSVVLDLGCGTGIVALLAVRAGARRVHAVDPSPAVWLVPELAAANGCADKIVVHHASSMDLEVPEKVDVCIEDLRGASPLLADHLPAVRDVRARWLAPGGVLVPQEDHLHVALVEALPFASSLQRGWESFERLGFDARSARESVLNSTFSDSSCPVYASDLLTTSASWASIDYRTFEGNALEGTVDLATTRPGIAHGLSVWFDTTLADGISFTTAPGHSLVYARMFLPLRSPQKLSLGDRARVTVRASVRGDRWAWDTTIVDADGTEKAKLRQSTFFGMPASPAALLRGSLTHRPQLSPRGERMRDALALMNGERTIEDIARAVSGRGPTSVEQLLEEVRTASERYAR